MSTDVVYPTRTYPYRPGQSDTVTALGAPSDSRSEDLSPALKVRLVGVDPAVGRQITPDELSHLADPMAVLLLKRGIFPRTLKELLKALDAQPSGLPVQTIFIVSEWGQIPLTDATAPFRRGLRYVVARGKQNATGADLLVSTAPPSDSPEIFLQVAAWDAENEVFHYYERAPSGATWFWEGNSWHALGGPTRGKGPFDSHVNGAPVMKELKAPWLHWHSSIQLIPRENFPQTHPINLPSETQFFQSAESAHILQEQIVEPSVRKWTEARLDGVLASTKGIADPHALMRQVLTATSINIASAQERSESSEQKIHIPLTMFADTDTLVEILLPETDIQKVVVDRPLYQQAVATLAVSLRDTKNGFTRMGDSFFAWPVPERAFEDIVLVEALLIRSILSAQFLTALLLVDFSNPIDSSRRAALLRHVPPGPVKAEGPTGLEEKMMESITAAASSGSADEVEILRFMQLADQAWQEDAMGRLSKLFTAVATRARTSEGVLDYLRLADWRRRSFRKKRRLAEFDLTLPFSSVPQDSAPLALMPDGTVISLGTTLPTQ